MKDATAEAELINLFQKEDLIPIKFNREEKPIATAPRKDIDDSDEMINVSMNTFGVTSADHTNTILKTIGLGSCVAVVLYDPATKVAGIVHIVEADRSKPGTSEWISVGNDIKNMLAVMGKYGVTQQARRNLQAHIIGGLLDNDLPQLARERLKVLGIHTILADERTEEEGSLRISHDIAIDARTGDVFNIKKIKSGDIDKFHALAGLTRTVGGALLTRDQRSLH